MSAWVRTGGVAALAAALASGLTLWATAPAGEAPGGVCASCPPRFLQLKKPLRPVDFSADVGGIRYAGNSGNHVDLHILMYGAYEKPILHFMRDAMRALFPPGAEAGPGGGVFVDVGANTGQHSLFMSRHVARVHAFEPFEPVLARFREMIAANGIENVAVHPVALGAEAGRSSFYAPPDDNLATGSFVEGFKPDNRYLAEFAIEVGDEALRAAGAERVDLVKIDVEGFEKAVLAGLRRTLEASRPLVVMELTLDPGLEHLFRGPDELLAAFPDGYECLAFDPAEGRRATGRYALRPCAIDPGAKGQWDLALLPREKRARLRLSNDR